MYHPMNIPSLSNLSISYIGVLYPTYATYTTRSSRQLPLIPPQRCGDGARAPAVLGISLGSYGLGRAVEL